MAENPEKRDHSKGKPGRKDKSFFPEKPFFLQSLRGPRRRNPQESPEKGKQHRQGGKAGRKKQGYEKNHEGSENAGKTKGKSLKRKERPCKAPLPTGELQCRTYPGKCQKENLPCKRDFLKPTSPGEPRQGHEYSRSPHSSGASISPEETFPNGPQRKR